MSAQAELALRPDHSVAASGLRESLLQLRRQRLLSFTADGDVAHVSYGDRIRELAAEWGLVLPGGDTSA
jgi:hypothetical protein